MFEDATEDPPSAWTRQRSTLVAQAKQHFAVLVGLLALRQRESERLTGEAQQAAQAASMGVIEVRDRFREDPKVVKALMGDSVDDGPVDGLIAVYRDVSEAHC